jgi:hypothetical protein
LLKDGDRSWALRACTWLFSTSRSFILQRLSVQCHNISAEACTNLTVSSFLSHMHSWWILHNICSSMEDRIFWQAELNTSTCFISASCCTLKKTASCKFN